jgi:RNA-splicing ligase RtcB
MMPTIHQKTMTFGQQEVAVDDYYDTFVGQYGKAKVFIQLIEEGKDRATIKQIYEFLSHPAFTNPIAIMPDCHKGNGCVIGFTMELTDQVIPNIVGVDINCGMLSMDFGSRWFFGSTDDIDKKIRERIPFGTNVRKKRVGRKEWDYFYKEASYLVNIMAYSYNKRFPDKPIKDVPEITPKWLENKCVEIGMDYARCLDSIGTLGGGNHFIELSKSMMTMEPHYWTTIHTGSRQFGLKICNFHQRKAPKDRRGLGALFDQDMGLYLIDMVVAQQYAHFNRGIIAREIKEIFDRQPDEVIETNHNFIDFQDWIIRKGAVKAAFNQKFILPFNMEDGILICQGRGNPDWNFSAPHGAGRVNSRRWAKDNLSLDDAKERMKNKGIYASKLPIDETRDAYKDCKIIEDAIGPTAKILDRLAPMMVCKE